MIPYIGRFAPSPSGPLHFGSLIAALGSFLDAKAHHGKWLVRMEDTDTPRMVTGADSLILKALEAFHLHWDEQIVYQSQRFDFYNDQLKSLIAQNSVYPCHCTRKQIKQLGGFYQGQCRELNLSIQDNALRFLQTQPVYQYQDRIHGQIQVDACFAEEDFILKRRDGLFAYQLAVVLDDAAQGITHIVRGADLLEPTVRQISFFRYLKYPEPSFAHLPLAVTKPGFKLSKQNRAPALDINRPQPQLISALQFLNMAVPEEIKNSNIQQILDWAIQQWQIDRIPPQIEVTLSI